MAEVLVRDDGQLYLGWDLPRSGHTPMAGIVPKENDTGMTSHFRVQCNAGNFLVRATDPVFVPTVLHGSLQQPMEHSRVNHAAAEEADRSMQSVLGLEDIDYATLTVEEITGKLALHYAAICTSDVIYM